MASESNNKYLAQTYYSEAQRSAKKDYQSCVSRGAYPYLQVLDEILSYTETSGEVSLGTVQIPMELIVGTKTAGRTTAFAPNFLPLLDSDTEFASKWINLCSVHLSEGIRDPITAYEFMNHFYVVEGNKRVSVLKYFGAVSIPGTVTRIMPKRTDDKENKIYYEFVDFYRVSQINYIWFSQEGCFAKLLELVGKKPNEMWNSDEKLLFSSVFARFKSAYEAKGGNKLSITVGDAFLAFLKIYSYDGIKDKVSSEIKQLLTKIWNELTILTEKKSIELLMDPSQLLKKSLLKFNLFTPSSPRKLKVSFIHYKNAATSGWTYSHELGRMYLEQTFTEQIKTSHIDDVTDENAYEMIENAIADKNNLIFTTTPELIGPSLKAAIEHPGVKILNCSLNESHSYIRTYYARMYEAKFLTGFIAGSMAENNKIRYIADYPIFGAIATINAFALGAKMAMPKAKIYLDWSSLKESERTGLHMEDIRYISGKDMIAPNSHSREFGLYYTDGGNEPVNLVMPVWHWGKFYEKLIQSILSGSWKETDSTSKALNYWWGLSSGVIDIVYSKKLPFATKRLIELLRHNIISGDFRPFDGILYSQNGIVQESEDSKMTPEEIITMDWLADNVIGFIPTIDQLTDEGKSIVNLQGVTTKF